MKCVTVSLIQGYRQRGMYKFVRKKKISKVVLIQLHHKLFMYKWNIWMLLQIIYAMLVKGRTEAVLIALSIFFFFRHVLLAVFFLFTKLISIRQKYEIIDYSVHILFYFNFWYLSWMRSWERNNILKRKQRNFWKK
jgi:hypothetical protein